MSLEDKLKSFVEKTISPHNELVCKILIKGIKTDNEIEEQLSNYVKLLIILSDIHTLVEFDVEHIISSISERMELTECEKYTLMYNIYNLPLDLSNLKYSYKNIISDILTLLKKDKYSDVVLEKFFD